MNKDMQKSPFDALKWTVVVLLVASGIVANYFYIAQPLPLRLIAWVVLACGSAYIALQTAQGANVVSFAKLARVELRKVVWPTRKETVQTTMIVVIMVFVVALLLWGVDSVLLWAIGLLTGHRG